jgi:hypothetical protein
MASRRFQIVTLTLVPLLGIIAVACPVFAQGDESLTIEQGSLEEIKGKRRTRILVIRPRVVDATDPAGAVAEAVHAGKVTERRQRRAYNVIASALNQYMLKYGRIEAGDAETAEYAVVFNMVRNQRILGWLYASGELFVVSHRAGVVRVLWRTNKEMIAEDAVKKLIAALKVVHGVK